jgi:hypothetical protein
MISTTTARNAISSAMPVQGPLSFPSPPVSPSLSRWWPCSYASLTQEVVAGETKVRTQALGSSRVATECVATCGFGGDTAAPPRTIKAPTLLLVPKLDLHNSIDDAIETATLVPSATLVRLDG